MRKPGSMCVTCCYRAGSFPLVEEVPENHHRPEGCIAECYVAVEALEFCSDYLKNKKLIGNPHERVDERIRSGKPLSKATIDVVDAQLLDQAHLYVLRNTAVVEPYIE